MQYMNITVTIRNVENLNISRASTSRHEMAALPATRPLIRVFWLSRCGGSQRLSNRCYCAHHLPRGSPDQPWLLCNLLIPLRASHVSPVLLRSPKTRLLRNLQQLPPSKITMPEVLILSTKVHVAAFVPARKLQTCMKDHPW